MTPAPDATSPASQVGSDALIEMIGDALVKASVAINAQYALAQAEYQGLDHLATKHDRAVREGRTAIREALAALTKATTANAVGMSEANAPIPAVQSGAVAWRYREHDGQDWQYEDHSPQHTPYRVGRMRRTCFPHYEPLYAAPQSEPLPGGVGELLERARKQIGLGRRTGADGGGIAPSNIYVIAAELVSALSGKEQSNG